MDCPTFRMFDRMEHWTIYSVWILNKRKLYNAFVLLLFLFYHESCNQNVNKCENSLFYMHKTRFHSTHFILSNFKIQNCFVSANWKFVFYSKRRPTQINFLPNMPSVVNIANFWKISSFAGVNNKQKTDLKQKVKPNQRNCTNDEIMTMNRFLITNSDEIKWDCCRRPLTNRPNEFLPIFVRLTVA